MRVSPVGWAYDSLDEVLFHAKRSAEVTHNHPEGIKGAQAVSAAVFMARHGSGKHEIKAYIEHTFGYNLDRTVAEIRPSYQFDMSCQGSVPEAIIAFLESSNFENAIRLAISLGGDSDTIACITGGIAEAYYKTVPDNIITSTLHILPPEFIAVIESFSLKFGGEDERETRYFRETPQQEIAIKSRDYWFKEIKEEIIFYHWALIEKNEDADACVVYFLPDRSGGIFDKMEFPSVEAAARGLRHNRFVRRAELFETDNQRKRRLPVTPFPPFYIAGNPNGPLYSSGRCWKSTETGRV
jgi:hypothetical protein